MYFLHVMKNPPDHLPNYPIHPPEQLPEMIRSIHLTNDPVYPSDE